MSYFRWKWYENGGLAFVYVKKQLTSACFLALLENLLLTAMPTINVTEYQEADEAVNFVLNFKQAHLPQPSWNVTAEKGQETCFGWRY